MKKYSKVKGAHAMNSLIVIAIALVAVIVASWGLVVTVFRPSQATSAKWKASVTVVTPVYLYQPFTINGKIVTSTQYLSTLEGEYVYLTLESEASEGKNTVIGLIDKKGSFSIQDASVSREGTYIVRVWQDDALTIEVPQSAGNATFSTTPRDSILAAITVKADPKKTNQFTVEGTIAKVVNGTQSGYVTPITVYFANKFCTKSPITVKVTKYYAPLTWTNIGKFSQSFTWDFKKCGGFWVRPFYKQQWLLNSSGELAEYFYAGEAPTPKPTPTVCGPKLKCAIPPEGCYYTRTTNCSCGELVCLTATPTVTPTASVSPPSCTKPPCAAPPTGCKYIDVTECSCGNLVCN